MIRTQQYIKLITRAKEIQQPKHQAPTISSIYKSLSRNQHRVRGPTSWRAIKEENKVANRDWLTTKHAISCNTIIL